MMVPTLFSALLTRMSSVMSLLRRPISPFSRLPPVTKALIVIPVFFIPLLVTLHLILTNPLIPFLGSNKQQPVELPRPSVLFPGRPDIPGPPSNITHWGERAIAVRQLAQWADMLMKDSTSEEVSLFEATLMNHFPYLAGAIGAIYRPWSTAPNHVSDHDHGFVICAGSGNFHLAAHLIRSLRRVHGSRTLIEIAYAGNDDLEPKHRKFLAGLDSDIEFIDVLKRFPAARWDLEKSGWAMKPFALLASAHPRALLMDADAVFLRSPDSIFEEHPALIDTGTLFFHDRAATGGDDNRRNWVKDQIAAAGIEPSHYLANESLFYAGATWYEQDSGVVAVDRTRPRVLLGLMFTTWMNTREVRDEVTYKVFYGDKESFWVAMELAGFDYAFQPWYAGTMGTLSDDENGRQPETLGEEPVEICGTHMLHLDYRGETPFWVNGGIYEHKNEKTSGYARMTHYWVGNTTEIRLTQPNWYWREGNVACLKETGVKALPESTLIAVQGNNEQALEVDEMIRKASLGS